MTAAPRRLTARQRRRTCMDCLEPHTSCSCNEREYGALVAELDFTHALTMLDPLPEPFSRLNGKHNASEEKHQRTDQPPLVDCRN